MTKTESPPGDMPMYRENYINALRKELLEMVEKELTPVALRYGYSEVPLESNIKWRPQVLVLGNYSSGKSTLINEFLGGEHPAHRPGAHRRFLHCDHLRRNGALRRPRAGHRRTRRPVSAQRP